MLNLARYNPDYLKSKAPEIFAIAKHTRSLDALRMELSRLAHDMMFETFDDYDTFSPGFIMRVRDCAQVMVRLMTRRSEDIAGFSVVEAIMDLAQDKPRPDLKPAFFAELLYLFLGLQGRGPGQALADLHLIPTRLKARRAAIERSRQLDDLSAEVQLRIDRSASGLHEASVKRRTERRRRILEILGATEAQWMDWQWQVENIHRDVDAIARVVNLDQEEGQAIATARRNALPFGITPHYLSLMDDDSNLGRDRAIRAQVFPPLSYVQNVTGVDGVGHCKDFMREADTSPIRLITRRYPAICIFKPYNTCPQICVYCQRNWEIDDAMQPGALAPEEQIKKAVRWIRRHPAVKEVLVTGGDPLAMSDADVDRILGMVAEIPSVERIRIGSRTPVTLPMRITPELADTLASYREPGRRQVALVTHVQHPYELTPDTAAAVERLRRRGLHIYNQLVYTFYVSRRYEAAHLRRLLSQVGIDPYYTFNTKGKAETSDYRVPLARLLQEQKEEARLLPGLSRTDEAVYNVPGMGKNYLRSSTHRDLISILPDGARLYEFHPWEKNVSGLVKTHVSEDVPILDYLQRLDAIGEDVYDYQTIWYYY
jgi:lysine 2,3-aminomutase